MLSVCLIAVLALSPNKRLWAALTIFFCCFLRRRSEASPTLDVAHTHLALLQISALY